MIELSWITITDYGITEQTIESHTVRIQQAISSSLPFFDMSQMQQHFFLLCARLVHSLNDNKDDPDPDVLVCSTAALFDFMMHV